MIVYKNNKIDRVLLALMGLWLAALVLSLYPYTADPANPIKLLISHFAMAACLGVLLAGALTGKIRITLPPALGAILLCWLAITWISMLYSRYPENGFAILRSRFLLALIALVAAQICRREKHLVLLFSVIIASMGIASCYGFLQRFGLDPFPWAQQHIEEYYGLPSTFANPNFAGHALVLALPMAAALAALACRTPGRLRPFKIIAALSALGLLSAHLIATHMRGGRIALLAMILFTLLLLVLRRLIPAPDRLARIVLLCLLIGAFAGVALLGGAALFLNTDQALPIDSSLALRLQGYHGAARIFLDHPLLGIGPGSYKIYNIAYWTDYEARWFAMTHKRNYHVHCDALESMAESGFPGGLAYFALLFFGLYLALKVAGARGRPTQTLLGLALAAACCGFAVDGLFGFNLRVPVSAAFFFLCLGAASGLTQQEAPVAASKRWLNTAALLLLLAASLFSSLAEVRAFQAERFHHAAAGAQYHANQYRKAGDWAHAENLLNNAATLVKNAADYAPAEPKHEYMNGVILMELGRFAEANTAFVRALKKNPHHPESLISLAQCALNHALQLSQKTKRAPEETAQVDQLLTTARKAAQRALDYSPYLADAHEALGRAAFMQAALRDQEKQDSSEGWEEAARHFEEALKLGTVRRALLLQMQAQALGNADHPAEAMTAIRQSVADAPELLESWRLYKSLVEKQGKTADWIDALSEGLARVQRQDPPPREVIALISGYLAECYLRQEKAPDLAREVLDQALALAPNTLSLWGARCALEPVEDRFDFLITALEKASAPLPEPLKSVLSLKEDDPDAYLKIAAMLAQVSRQRGQQQSAADMMRRYGWLAQILAKRLSQIDLPSERLGEILTALGECFVCLEDYDRADHMLKQAVQHLPETRHAIPIMLRSRALAALDEPQHALLLARQAATLAPSAHAVRWNLARRLAESGLTAEARFEYESLLRLSRPGTPPYQELRQELDALGK